MSKIIIAIYILTTSMALVILKIGAKEGAPAEMINGKLNININTYTLVGMLLYGISFVVYTYLLSKFDLGYIIPLLAAFVYILIFVASYFIFNETFTVLKIGGIVLIISGLVLLNISK